MPAAAGWGTPSSKMFPYPNTNNRKPNPDPNPNLTLTLSQDGNVLYHQLLRAELLGVPVAPASPDRGGGGGENSRGCASPMSSPAKKMFRYKSSDR